MKLRNACGVRGVTMVPEADGDDSRHWGCREQQARVGKYPPGTVWSVLRYLGGTATRGDLHAVIGRGTDAGDIIAKATSAHFNQQVL